MNYLCIKRHGSDPNSILLIVMIPRTKENYLSAAIFFILFYKKYTIIKISRIFSPSVIPLYNNRI